MKRALIALIAGVGMFASNCFAEVFFEINYAMTLGDIKKIYPKAQYKKINASWVKDNDAFINISGPGLAVDLKVAFEDLRPATKNLLPKISDSENKEINDFYRLMIAQSDDEALTVEWVRIVYPSPIPIEIFKKRYGKPAACEHDESFSMQCRWPEKALLATLTSDEKFVTNAETSFTKTERQLWYLKQGNPIPPWLQ